ncbi:MAG: uncharacterized protein KVP18_000268, partial [Porospora cf. gigantea A]|uniref:uncharacterized protein n=2 Tax=Porospora cf. gigantea A TaxID=2853593 RepID=UPI003559A4B8
MATWQGLATPPPCVPEMPVGVSAVEGTVVLNVHEEPSDSPWQWAVQQMAPGLADIEESRPEYYNARTALWDIRSNECASACLGESFSPVDTTSYKAEAKWSGGPPPTVKPPPIPPGVSMSCVLTQGGLQVLQGPHSIFDDPEEVLQEAQMSQPPQVSMMQPLLFPVPQRDPAMQVNRENDGSSTEPPTKKAKTSEEEPPIAEPMPPIDDELGYVESVLSSRLRRVQMDKGRLIAGIIDTIHRLDRKMNWEWREVVEQRMIQQYKQEFIEERLSAREAYRLARQARDLLGFRMLCRDANCLPALWVEQALCFVCGQADEYDADPIVFCDGCFVPTHLTCVGCPPPRSKKGRKQAKKLLSRSGRKDQKNRVVRQSSSNSNGDDDEWYCCVCRLVMSQMPPSMP